MRGKCAFCFFTISIMFLSGCSSGILQSRHIKKPFPPGSDMSCSKFREDIAKLRIKLRDQSSLSCKTTLAELSIQPNAKNTKAVSEPKEKVDLMLSSQLLLTASEAMGFVRTINSLDFTAVTCREIEETFSPGIGEGLAYADFRKVGEDFKTHFICDDDRLLMVFPANNGPVDEYDRETIFSLLGNAAGSAVTHGVKKAIP